MNATTALYLSLSAIAGCCIALQATVNGRFRQNLDNPTFAVFFSICGTILCAAIAVVVLRPPVPTWEQFRATQWWNWIGGPLGALIVLAGAMLTPKIGAAAFICAVVAGQLLLSILIDHFGWFGMPVVEANWKRLLGAAFIILGVVCVKYL